MRELNADMFVEFESGKYDAICITTNGIIKRDGSAVMGAGVALEATKRFKGIEFRLGKKLKDYGNMVHVLGKARDGHVVAFPTKNHWRDKSDMELIIESAKYLMKVVEAKGWQNVIISRPGCGYGGLKWNDVKAEIENIFDDRIIIINK